MKKLMVAAVAVLGAVAANAAAMVWSSDVGSIMLPDSSYADGNVTMYLYELTAADYATFSGSAADISKAVFDKYGTTGTSALDDFGVTQITDSRTFSSGDTAYAAVVFAYNDGADDWYKGNIASYTFAASTDGIVGALDVNLGGDGNVVGDSGAISWAKAGDVPEPTSGLLMLLGVAGLALRRKRA